MYRVFRYRVRQECNETLSFGCSLTRRFGLPHRERESEKRILQSCFLEVLVEVAPSTHDRSSSTHYGYLVLFAQVWWPWFDPLLRVLGFVLFSMPSVKLMT